MSKEEDYNNHEKKALNFALSLLGLMSIILLSGLFVYLTINSFNDANPSQAPIVENVTNESDLDRIENGIHVRTGLIDAEGLMTVVGNCTSCHSSKIITQNRMSAEGWNSTIKWMQETQNLWDLGSNQEVIVNYLVNNYPLKKKGRRENLPNPVWYELSSK